MRQFFLLWVDILMLMVLNNYGGIDYSKQVNILIFPPNSNLMRRQPNSNNLGKVYREFSRQHYQKYRSQFPRLQESEIIARIIKEWQNMDLLKKQELASHYLKLRYISPEEEKSNSTPLKTPSKNTQLRLMSTQRTKVLLSELKSHSQVGKIYEDESEFNRHSQRYSGESHDEFSSSPRLLIDPSLRKMGKQMAHKRYICFYKHHYKKIAKEHLKWNASKISKIIKLLWKKETNYRKNKKSHSKKIRKDMQKEPRRIPGRTLFRKVKHSQGMSSKESREDWKRLPIQTKVLYNNMLQPFPKYLKEKCTINLRPSESETDSQEHPFAYIHNIMK